jgi:hypothetical protein
VSGAPLVMRTLMVHLYLVHHCYIAVAHHIHSAPLMSISAIALFLVVPVTPLQHFFSVQFPQKQKQWGQGIKLRTSSIKVVTTITLGCVCCETNGIAIYDLCKLY